MPRRSDLIDLNRGFIEPFAIAGDQGGRAVVTREFVPPELRLTVDEVRRRHSLRVLELCDWNRSQAAVILGIGRKTLLRRLKRWKIQPPKR
jgi:transcriptional regulator of acetoin/glycerol metabolism